MSNDNWKDCCRLCLTDKVDAMRSIFDDAVDDRALPQKILASLSVEICADDKLSTKVCHVCINKINNWHSYKQRCSNNQQKLEQWLQSTSSHLHNMSLQIKDEPVDVDDFSCESVVNGEVPVKAESAVEELNDLPPPLTPQASRETDDDDDDDDEDYTPSSSPPKRKRQTNIGNDPDYLKCKTCGKAFSRVANRRKHEQTIHGINRAECATRSASSGGQAVRSRASEESQSLVASSKSARDSNPEQKKIAFAAGLKLSQKKSTVPTSHESLSKIEFSYIEKCKAMIVMFNTLTCACHNTLYRSAKGLLNHLRSLRIWFPSYTCYHCMITFQNKSEHCKHYNRCRKYDLEALTQLANLRKRSEVKTRIYQNYKCTKCGFMYTFHEDFCAHIDEMHSDIDLPAKCNKCKKLFHRLEDYQEHLYLSCVVEYYCDVCFVTVKSLDEFKKHAVEHHDQSEGFALVQDDDPKKRKRSSVSAPVAPKIIKKEAEEDVGMARRKRRSTYRTPILEAADEDDRVEDKVINPCVVPRVPGTRCPLCSRDYSTNNNMYRHYKTHFEDEAADNHSLYCCPDCGGMFTASEWEKHKEKHKKKACHECGKVFQFQSELDQHRSVHLNLKVYRDSKTKAYKSAMVNPNAEVNRVVMCDICNTMFTSLEQLNVHKRIHEIKPSTAEVETRKPFNCRICNQTFLGYKALHEHRKTSHPEAMVRVKKDFPMKCAHCDKIITSAGIYYNHTLVHLRENNAKEVAAKKDNYHVEDFAPDNDDESADEDESESYHTCKRCFKVCSTRGQLKGHMKSHGLKLPASHKALKAKHSKKVWCDICHTAFDNNALLNRHKEEEHDSDDQMPELTDEREPEVKTASKAPFVFTCDVCVQTFATKGSLKRHKERHACEKMVAKSKQTLVFCKYCRIPFANVQKLDEHMDVEHSEKMPSSGVSVVRKNLCTICKKQCKSLPSYYAHMGWHKRKENKMNAILNEAAKSRVVEPPREEFKCSKCKMVLPNDTALQIHILEKHRNVNAVAFSSRCTSCNLDFSSQDEYEQHKHLHTLVQPARKSFPCKSCPAAFAKQETLHTHVRQFHNKSASPVVSATELRCSQCNRIFDKLSSLNIHLKVHEKQKLMINGTNANAKADAKMLYSCSICSMGFNLPKDLRTHTIQAHPF